MKKTANKLLAFLLTLTMLASTLAMAVIPVNAAEDVVLVEDFENTATDKVTNNVLTTDVLQSVWDNGITLGITADPAGGSNQVLQLKRTAAGDRTRLVPNALSSANFIISFDFYFASESTTGYNGFHVTADDDDANHIFQIWDRETPVRAYHNCDNKITNAAASDIIDEQTWYTAKLIRQGTTMTLQICEKDTPDMLIYDASNTYDCLTDTTVPRLMFTASGTWTGTDGSIYLDNYTITNKDVLEDGENVINEWKAHTEDFSNFDKVEDNKINATPIWTTTDSSYLTIETDTETSNKYAKLTPKNGQQLRFNEIQSKYYSFSFDFKFDAANSDGYGIYLISDLGTGRMTQILNNAIRFYCTGTGCNQIINAQAVAFTGWTTCVFEANGDTHTIKVFDKESGTVLYSATQTWTCTGHGEGERMPALNFYTTGDNDIFYIDNIRYENTTGKLDVVGMQASAIDNSGTTETYAVRFIGTVNSLNTYEKLGFEVVASYTEGGSEKTKTFRLDTCQVYTSLLATTSGNEKYVVTAQQLGGEYLIALNITDIPKDAGAITFTVQSFGYYNGGIEVRSEVASYTATPGDTTVTLAKPAA